MARPKKEVNVEISEDAKPKRRYTKRLPEQREFQDYIVNGIIPYIEEHRHDIEKVLPDFINNKIISEDDWNLLYNIVNEICNLVGDNVGAVFNHKYITEKYKKNHSTYYYIQAGDFAKYAMKHLDRSKMYDKNDKVGLGSYQLSLYLVAQHLYFFITVKEKI